MSTGIAPLRPKTIAAPAWPSATCWANPAITAPITSLINMWRRRKLDLKEKAHLDRASARIRTRLRPDHRWLRSGEYM